MANAEAWSEGWQIGANRREEGHAHKQALKDEQHENRLHQLIADAKSLQDKISTYKDADGKPIPGSGYDDTMQEITKNAQAIRELYDPNKHPGAIERFGWILTDHLGLTNPKKRIQSEAVKRLEGMDKDAKVAQGIAAAAPLSPAQTAALQTKADVERQNANADARIKWLQAHGAPPEIIEQAVQAIGGVPLSKPVPLTGAKPYPGPDGKYYQAMRNADGTITEEQMPADYAPPASTKAPSNVNTQRDEYRASHGIPPGQPLTFQQELDFVKQMALARNPFGPARLGMEREGLNLREQEAGFKDFLALQKQLTPIERVLATAVQSDDYVNNPTGPGDVALTLAFFDAIKTTGVRFTKQEQDFITGSRGVVDGAQAKFDQGFMGTVFSPDQRKIIASIVKSAGNTAAQQKDTLIGGAGAFNPKAAAAAGGTQPPGSGGTSTRSGISVTAPDGSIHTFPNQESADKFKKAAGIP